MNDISNIEKKLQIKINIINKANQEIYTSGENTNNKQTITLKTPYINHIGEYIENEIEDIKNKNLVVVDNIMNHYQNNNSDFNYKISNFELSPNALNFDILPGVRNTDISAGKKKKSKKA
jgi:hypothetical protein